MAVFKKQQQIVGLDESVYGGTIQPIDFRTMEVANDIRGQGLENFIKMVQLFQREYKQYSLALNFVYLPKGRKFSYLPNGQRRIAAIVAIKSKYTNSLNYLIEVSTIDNKSLSTLLINNILETVSEDIFSQTIRSLVFNSGSWNSVDLKGLNYVRLKHLRQSKLEWSKRILKNLN